MVKCTILLSPGSLLALLATESSSKVKYSSRRLRLLKRELFPAYGQSPEGGLDDFERSRRFPQQRLEGFQVASRSMVTFESEVSCIRRGAECFNTR